MGDMPAGVPIDTVTVAVLMRASGVTRTAICNRIHAGTLPATLDTSVRPARWRIPVAAASRYRPARRRWTAADDDLLIALLGTMPVAAIARRLHRSPTAVRLRMKRLGHTQRSEHYTARLLAAELGASHCAVRKWIGRGLIVPRPYRPRAGGVRCWLFTQEEVERFIAVSITDPWRLQRWTWKRIPRDTYFRNYAAAIASGEARDG